ncbi:hypothetical protein L2E82_25322 [Cichorium intybus]|uniref:Uncharacterized protein n=1 Tax=Cichorium intybus TaxID=13427 RepID=A0ACB9E2Y5_CICIN|nr:hypothetical protein L2E82_25322 [Cichorium intybus]
MPNINVYSLLLQHAKTLHETHQIFQDTFCYSLQTCNTPIAENDDNRTLSFIHYKEKENGNFNVVLFSRSLMMKKILRALIVADLMRFTYISMRYGCNYTTVALNAIDSTSTFVPDTNSLQRKHGQKKADNITCCGPNLDLLIRIRTYENEKGHDHVNWAYIITITH